MNHEARRKGREAEAKFKAWLDKNNIPYWYIKQEIDSFSLSLKQYFDAAKPDYMLLLPNIGSMLVDVKHRNLSPKYKNFLVSYERILKHSHLLTFGLPVWYAMSSESCGYETWFWIPVSKALAIGEKIKIKEVEIIFLAIPVEECIQVASKDSIGELFSGYLREIFKNKAGKTQDFPGEKEQ